MRFCSKFVKIVQLSSNHELAFPFLAFSYRILPICPINLKELKDILTVLKSELENISTWMRIKKLSLNTSKREYIVIVNI